MTTEIAVSSVAEKRSLQQRTGASTVDMSQQVSAQRRRRRTSRLLQFVLQSTQQNEHYRKAPWSVSHLTVIHAQQLSLASSLCGPGNSLNFCLSKDSAQALEALRRVALLDLDD